MRFLLKSVGLRKLCGKRTILVRSIIGNLGGTPSGGYVCIGFFKRRELDFGDEEPMMSTQELVNEYLSRWGFSESVAILSDDPSSSCNVVEQRVELLFGDINLVFSSLNTTSGFTGQRV